MIQGPLTTEAMEYAFRRLDDFHRVHVGSPMDSRQDAVTVLMDSLGWSEDLRADFDEAIDRRASDDLRHKAGIYYGVLFGLLIAQYHDQ